MTNFIEMTNVLGIIFGIVLILLFNFIVRAVKRYKKLSKERRVIKVKNKDDICPMEEEHLWKEVFLLIDQSRAMGLGDEQMQIFCVKCGVLQKDRKRKFNKPALDVLNRDIKTMAEFIDQANELDRRLDFDMTLFYDGWLDLNGKFLIDLMKNYNTLNGRERLYATFNAFFVTGLEARQKYQENIIKQLEDEKEKN